MKYAMLIHDKPGYYEALSDDEQEAVVAEYRALAQDAHARGSAQLHPIETATTVRVQNGQTLLTDGGRFVDTKEVFGAYHIVEVDNLDDAIEVWPLVER